MLSVYVNDAFANKNIFVCMLNNLTEFCTYGLIEIKRRYASNTIDTYIADYAHTHVVKLSFNVNILKWVSLKPFRFKFIKVCSCVWKWQAVHYVPEMAWPEIGDKPLCYPMPTQLSNI